ncbi:chloride channel protein [Brooklawnia cerclae]|uniref:CIC family chloride channel protein n=1 Tax=Brooklawnia cerclae TaxID=349934 RepID=A0ABX0SFS8_9ACTN|nr:CIC family chloride channel protein [Brooklawnia cerclae]
MVAAGGSGEHRALRFAIGVVAAGASAGLVSLALSHLLRLVERVAWGSAATVSLLAGVETASPGMRVLVLLGAGVIGAAAWFALYRWARPIVPLARAVAGERMSVLTTTIHAGVQVVLVGLGASIGREAAPRELSGALASWIGRQLRLPATDVRLLLGCGAGAGLAAIYSVPVSGVLFALEILLVEITIRSAVCATAVTGIAVLIAQGPRGGAPFYDVSPLDGSASLVVWSLPAGLVIGLVAGVFAVLAARFESSRPRDWRLFVAMPLVFAGVGAVSVAWPEVLGNGQSVAQAAFDGRAVAPILVLAGLKAVTTLATIRAGTWGGTLNPSIAIGAGIGAGLGLAWSSLWPGSGAAAFAFVGAAAFLATTQRAPATSVMLVVELTHQGGTVLVPTLIAVAGAVATGELVRRLALRRGYGAGTQDP